MAKLTHFDREGRARMVDVSAKPVTKRVALASGRVLMKAETLERIINKKIGKGDVWGVARVAGIMAAKRTGEMIPMCHPLAIDSVEIQFQPDVRHSEVHIEALVKSTGKTGVEMEALNAASTYLLTVWDMVKQYEKDSRGQYPDTRILDLKVLQKTKG